MERIELGDGIAGMLALPKGAASLVLWDPPWGATQARWDVAPDWPKCWEAIDHVLASRGNVVVFGNLRVACAVLRDAARPYAYDLIWRKNRASGHLNAKRAPLRAHETMLVFGGWGYAVQRTEGHEPLHAATQRTSSQLYGASKPTASDAGTTQRYATSVLDVPVVRNDGDERIHPTQKPVALYRWLVRAYACGGLVIDPMCGSGAAIHAARAEGCSAIGWETDPASAEAAQRWLATPPASATRSVPTRP